MQFNTFKKQLSKFVVFSLSDIKKVDSQFYPARLNEWQAKGYIKKLRRGYYMFSDVSLDESTLFLIANRLYAPSYVSGEMALSYYGLIPEGVYSVTSVSSKKTAAFKTPIGKFSYRTLKPSLLFGYSLEKSSVGQYKIADIEKAVLDYLYFNPNMNNESDFFEWRFNGEDFFRKANLNKFSKYLSAFSNKRLEFRAKRFLEFIHKK